MHDLQAQNATRHFSYSLILPYGKNEREVFGSKIPLVPLWDIHAEQNLLVTEPVGGKTRSKLWNVMGRESLGSKSAETKEDIVIHLSVCARWLNSWIFPRVSVLQPLLSEKATCNHSTGELGHTSISTGKSKSQRDSLFAAAIGKSHETAFPEGKCAFHTPGIMGAVVTLYTEQSACEPSLSYVNALFVVAWELELRVLEGRAGRTASQQESSTFSYPGIGELREAPLHQKVRKNYSL